MKLELACTSRKLNRGSERTKIWAYFSHSGKKENGRQTFLFKQRDRSSRRVIAAILPKKYTQDDETITMTTVYDEKTLPSPTFVFL